MITVNAKELKDLLVKNPGMTLLNVRPASTRAEGCLPGSKPMPQVEIKTRAAELPKDKESPIAVYGTDLTCESSTRSADILEALGYKHIYNFTSGLKGWNDAGFPLAGC